MSEFQQAHEQWIARLHELAADIMNPHLELGPLDREDVRDALHELLYLRQNKTKAEQLVEAAA